MAFRARTGTHAGGVIKWANTPNGRTGQPQIGNFLFSMAQFSAEGVFLSGMDLNFLPVVPMTMRYIPRSQLRANAKGPPIFVKSSGFQSVLRSFCAMEGDFPRPFHGLAALHLELAEDLMDPRVRVEIDGRTIGYFCQADALAYQKKLEHEQRNQGAWNREDSSGSPILVPVRIVGGSLGRHGPPFYFFAQIPLQLKIDHPWDFESPIDPDKDFIGEQRAMREPMSTSRKAISAHPKRENQRKETDGNRSRHEHRRAGKRLGRGLGYFLVALLFSATCFISWLIMR